MDDAAGGRMIQPDGHLQDVAHRLAHRQPAAFFHQGAQIVALDIFEGDEVQPRSSPQKKT